MHDFDIQITKCDNFNEVLQNIKKNMSEREMAGHTYFEEVEEYIQEK